MRKILSNLKIGEKGLIDEINIDEIPLKLLEMGCLPGNSIQLIQIAPFGDPYYFNINDSHVAIRKETANEIFVTTENTI
ncbi:iron transporter [Flavobacterium sp. 316]|uniref:Ferrous iron transport protein A n=1 Tax=Flavobacterium sediminilitoris TaxID=2024526 RepID=A0ABY4HQ40_9FLAO|nr:MULTISPECIES: FeoA family protein [Flavobacterium]KIX21246.1 iron transporter [Flavobacterium sp. 316]UOX34992.1 ferrous iron transport protein A [Flavobacterium sediminilitoris]